MELRPTPIKDLYLAQTDIFRDERGAFARLFCDEELAGALDGRLVKQINHSHTKEKATIRGMHFQKPPFSELKCVRCLKGSIFDVAIDLRENSPTYLKWHGEILSADNADMLVIPEGFAHGFQTLEDNCELLYLHTQSYRPGAEDALHYADPELDIEWPLPPSIVSEKDQRHSFLADREGISL